MRSKLITILLATSTIIASLLILPTYVSAEIKLVAEVDVDILTVGQRFTYTITASSDKSVPEIVPPPFDGVDIVSGPSSSSRVQIVNGAMSHTKSLTYVLRPFREGHIIILPATAGKGSRAISSNQIELEILPSGAPPPTHPGSKTTPNKGVDKDSKNLPEVFIVATADKKSAYRMEMIKVTYDLYLRTNVETFNIVKLPSAKGFWREEFESANRPVLRDETIAGIPYKVATIRREGLFPTRTGTLEIEPISVDVSVIVQDNRRRRRDPFDVFDDPFFGFNRRRTETRTIYSDPIEINVEEPSFNGRPQNYSGEVGDFNLSVKYDKREVNQHDALTITVAIGGTGYLKSISAPEFELPSGFEVFDPTVEENITTTGNRMRGRKTFTYLAIPRRSGTFELPALEFCYFDPEQEKYMTSKAGGISLNVKPAEGGGLAGSTYQPSEVTLLDSDIRFIKELNSPLTQAATPPYKSTWFLILIAASPLLFLAGLTTENIIIRRSADPRKFLKRKAPVKLQKSLNNAKKLNDSNESKKALIICNRAFQDFIGVMINEPPAGLTKDLISKRLVGFDVNSETLTRAIDIIDECEMIEFSGISVSPAQVANIIEEAETCASELRVLL